LLAGGAVGFVVKRLKRKSADQTLPPATLPNSPLP
jgi:hypothetical protein